MNVTIHCNCGCRLHPDDSVGTTDPVPETDRALNARVACEDCEQRCAITVTSLSVETE
jgi:hypothetical protein